MSVTSLINNQMNEFGNQLDDVNKSFELIYRTTQDIFSDLKDGKRVFSTMNRNMK